MSAIPLPILQNLHPYYLVSNDPDLDVAFEEGKRRYVRALEREIELVKQATRMDYESAFLGRAATTPDAGAQP